jgi:hypothetical protein
MNTKLITLSITICLLWAGQVKSQVHAAENNDNLSKHLQTKDSLLFDIAFNSCDVGKLSTILANDFVFLQDRGLEGATGHQGRQEFEAKLKSACERKAKGEGSMRRELVKNSLQTFPINSSEAIQTGVQRFYMSEKGGKETMVEVSKFTRNWRKENRTWKLESETDFLVNTSPQAVVAERYKPEPYVPAPLALYNTISKLDSIYFDTYNTCKIGKMDSLTAEDLEFYHDRGGLMTSKKEYIESIKKNICGKVTRKLAKGSIEVYEIPGFGAVEEGYHSFHNLVEQSESHPSKFIIIWRFKENKWQITRVVSLH